MARYRISSRARANLLDIFESSLSKFGAYQAEAYTAGLERTFGLLADFPTIGVSADELRQGLRRFRFQSHYILYSEESDYVLIRALIHTRQDLRPSLFD